MENKPEGLLLFPPAGGRNRLLGSLPQADLASLTPHLTERTFHRGEVLEEAGNAVEHIYFPHSGLISLVVPTNGGQSVELALIGREGAVGLSAAVGSLLAPNTAVCASPGSAARIPAWRLASLMDRSPALRTMIVGYGDVMLAQIQQMVACNVLHDVEARLCRWLLQASDRTGARQLAITQEQLSELLCVRRTTITLVCGGLRMRGIIQIRRGRVEISDPVALERQACSCYRVTRSLIDELIERLGKAHP
jgi:CRP-like cAMP-binding protein